MDQRLDSIEHIQSFESTLYSTLPSYLVQVATGSVETGAV